MRYCVRNGCASGAPEGAAPSDVPGLSQAEYEELAENLLWYARRSALEVLRDSDALVRQQRRWEQSGFIDRRAP